MAENWFCLGQRKTGTISVKVREGQRPRVAKNHSGGDNRYGWIFHSDGLGLAPAAGGIVAVSW